jgi:hypothetical protein
MIFVHRDHICAGSSGMNIKKRQGGACKISLKEDFKRPVSVGGWKDLFLHLFKTQMF